VSTCTVSGALSDDDGALHAATAQMTAGHWGQLAPAGVPAGAISDHELLGVSCTVGVQCTAVGYFGVNTSTGGTQAMAATWNVGSPPGPISGLHRTATSTTTVQLAWNAATNPGTGIDHYEVTAKPAGGGMIDEGPVAGTSVAVNRLLPGTTYVLSVYTVGSDGQTSNPMSITVPLRAIRPTAPKITRVVGLPRALQISWTSPKSTGGAPITAYDVTASCPGVVKRVHFGGAAHVGVVAGLPTRGACIVRVAAVNKVGPGPSSTPVLGHPRA
jgi:endoglucanase